MSFSGQIEHLAKVIGVEGNQVTVEIEVQEACEACRAKSVCSVSGGERKVMVIKTGKAAQFAMGETVQVAIEKGVGIRAVVIAYVLPFLVLIVSLLGMIAWGMDEIVAALFSIGALAAYFTVVLSLRKRIEEGINFKITKIST